MKHLLLTFSVAAFMMFFVSDALAQKQMRAYLNDQQFYSEEYGSYLEVQLKFASPTLNYKSVNNHLVAHLEISHVFRKGEHIEFFDKYTLDSPLFRDSIIEDFYDIQRYPLNPGTYIHEIVLKDLNSDTPELSVEREVSIRSFARELAISSITPAESIQTNTNEELNTFTKMGYDVIPMTSNYYPVQMNWMPYYAEIYNTRALLDDSVYVVEQKIISNETRFDMDHFSRYFRLKTSEIQPLAKVIDISMLPTGNYTLELNILNRDKEVLASTRFNFDRNNTEEVNSLAIETIVLDPAFAESIPSDSTGYYVAALIPISRPAEVKNIIALLKERNNEKNKKYIQAFWREAKRNGAYEEWMKFKAQVMMVEKLFGTNYQVGFETDRGRVYLQYGQPNQVTEQAMSPSEYPYEIWQYDKIDRFSNRRFVFYNTTNINNDYKLLHSDMVGELQNFRWQYALNKRNTSDKDLDNPSGSDYQQHFGGNSSLYYNSY